MARSGESRSLKVEKRFVFEGVLRIMFSYKSYATAVVYLVVQLYWHYCIHTFPYVRVRHEALLVLGGLVGVLETDRRRVSIRYELPRKK